MSSVMEVLLPFDCLNFSDFSILSQNLVSNGWNFIKLIPGIYVQCVIMQVKFCQDVLSSRGVIVL